MSAAARRAVATGLLASAIACFGAGSDPAQSQAVGATEGTPAAASPEPASEPASEPATGGGAAQPAPSPSDATPPTPPAESAAPAARSRVLRRVDEQGVKHYVIEPREDEDSSSSSAPEDPGPSAFSASAGMRGDAQRSAALGAPRPLPSIGSDRPERAEPYQALADSEGTATAIRELELQIARDREVLKQLISETSPAGANPAEDPRLREIAARLPRLLAELEALRRETQP